jgi:hypothetical protein
MKQSAVHHFYAFQDGDVLSDNMGVIIDEGFGLKQYWDAAAGKVTNTDFTKHPATLFPQPFSAQAGAIIVPEDAGSGWYYNNDESAAAVITFDANGKSTGVFVGLFEKTSVSMNGKIFPALKIVGNLATKEDHTDKTIYYKSIYRNRQVTCHKVIPIVESAGSSYEVNLSVLGQDGAGDNVLTNDNDWVQYTATLKNAGNDVTSDLSFVFQKLQDGAWIDMVNKSGLAEININSASASIKLYNAAVEGIELYRCLIKHDNNQYIKAFEVTDTHDPFYIFDGCNIQGESVAVGQKVTFNPQIYDRSTNELATGSYATSNWTFEYSFVNSKTGAIITDITKDNLDYDKITTNGGGISTVIEASV